MTDRRQRIGGSRRPPLVLCYHAISDDWHDDLAVRPGAFEQQIRSLLARGYVPVSAEHVLSGARRTFHVTFDDAFVNITSALRLLGSLGVPATVFVSADFARDGRPLDVEELSEKRAAPNDIGRTMTWDQLRAIADERVEIGSHTLTHPHLPRLGDDELHRELRESREVIEAELGRRCPYISYPYGEHDARVRAASRAAGYAAAFAQGYRQRSFDLHAVPRVSLYRADTPMRVRLKLSRPGRTMSAIRN